MKSKGTPAMTMIRTKNSKLPVVPDTSSQYLAEMMKNVKPSTSKKAEPTVLTGRRQSDNINFIASSASQLVNPTEDSSMFELKAPSGATLPKSNQSSSSSESLGKSTLIQEMTSSTTLNSASPAPVPIESAPIYKLTYQSLHNDYSKYTTGRTRTDTIIDALCIRFSLPGVSSVQDIDLDTTTRSASLHVPRLYKICIDLPVSVDYDNGNAKFDKKKSELTVVLPILMETEVTESYKPYPPTNQHCILIRK
jgi:hypothetical protein